MRFTLMLLLLFLSGGFAYAQTRGTLHLRKADSIYCINREKLLQYSPVNDQFQLVKKRAVQNFVPSIAACGYGYRYDAWFEDKACQLLLPKWLNSHSLIFADNDFFISFDDSDSTSANCIVLNYRLNTAYQRTVEYGLHCDSLVKDSKTMYRFRNGKGMYVGEIFLNENISVAYYTSEIKMVQQLQTCILSCRLE